jgi:hypothetical protein
MVKAPAELLFPSFSLAVDSTGTILEDNIPHQNQMRWKISGKQVTAMNRFL